MVDNLTCSTEVIAEEPTRVLEVVVNVPARVETQTYDEQFLLSQRDAIKNSIAQAQAELDNVEGLLSQFPPLT